MSSTETIISDLELKKTEHANAEELLTQQSETLGDEINKLQLQINKLTAERTGIEIKVETQRKAIKDIDTAIRVITPETPEEPELELPEDETTQEEIQ